MDWLLQLDTQLFLAINGNHNETWDGIMWWISGKTTWWPFYLLLLGYLAWRKGWQLVPVILFIVIVITLADQTSVHLFKNVIQRLRPSHDPALEDMVHLVNNKRGGLYGFISSHAANSAGVAVLTALWVRKKWFTALMVCWALLIGFSRIYLGVHYPWDVIAGLLWGAGCGWVVFLLFRWTLKKMPQTWWIAETNSKSES
ncbi:MAG: phosphatase PAP2 family protein [Bacteroidales bacterium]|nr:phosphatase PAP2 family protein [Bacteroidales bacterium]